MDTQCVAKQMADWGGTKHRLKRHTMDGSSSLGSRDRSSDVSERANAGSCPNSCRASRIRPSGFD